MRYPGGKSRAVKKIEKYIPQGIDSLCSPFFGGGSLEIFLAINRNISIVGYDLFSPVCWFWQAALSCPSETADLADSYREYDNEFVIETKKTKSKVRGLKKEKFLLLRDKLREADSYSIENAACFYALNRSSFSGETLSGGYSKRASYARFTDSSIERLRKFSLPTLKVKNECFTVSIPENSDKFMYCDPPYLLENGSNNLYGNKGNMHKGFDHAALREVLDSHSGWALSYNDCEKIRKMYDKYRIIDKSDMSWAYGMSNIYTNDERESGKKIKMKSKTSEILIIKD